MQNISDTDLYPSLGRSEVVRVRGGRMQDTAAGRRDREGKEKNRAAARATPGSQRKPSKYITLA